MASIRTASIERPQRPQLNVLGGLDMDGLFEFVLGRWYFKYFKYFIPRPGPSCPESLFFTLIKKSKGDRRLAAVFGFLWLNLVFRRYVLCALQLMPACAMAPHFQPELAIEIEKERRASPKLTREIVYEKKEAKYEGVGRFAHKLRQFYEFYLLASFF